MNARTAQAPARPKEERRQITNNRRARHEYSIEETVEAGMVLTGTEIKSVRAGKVNLQDAYARIENGEAWLHNMHVSPYEQGNRMNVDPLRPRKLLLKRPELNRLFTKSPQQWQARPLTEADRTAFREAQEAAGIPCVAAHDTYLINPAAADPAVLERSRAAMVDELERAHFLGVPALVMHLGAKGT